MRRSLTFKEQRISMTMQFMEFKNAEGKDVRTSDHWALGQGGDTPKTGVCTWRIAPGQGRDGKVATRVMFMLAFAAGEQAGMANAHSTESFEVTEKTSSEAQSVMVAKAKAVAMSVPADSELGKYLALLGEQKIPWSIGFDAVTGEVGIKRYPEGKPAAVKMFKNVSGLCYVFEPPPRDQWPKKINEKDGTEKVEVQYAEVVFVGQDKHATLLDGTYVPTQRVVAKKGAAQVQESVTQAKPTTSWSTARPPACRARACPWARRCCAAAAWRWT